MKKLLLIPLIYLVISSCSKTESAPPVVNKLSGCDSIKQGLLKTTSDTIRLISCLNITSCDSIRLGILKPNTNDTLRLLSCIKISGCDSVRLGLLKSFKDLLRLNCNSLSITIGTQNWMTVNLDIETYRNGDTIPQITDPTAWVKSTKGAWCYYNNDSANGAKYGKLYNWYAVNDPRGLSPKGWHVPSDAEWTTLSTFIGGVSLAGGKMKATTGWNVPNIGATNETGFAGLPGGARYADGKFNDVGSLGVWWSSTEYLPYYAFYRSLQYYNVIMARSDNYKLVGFSVRCIKD